MDHRMLYQSALDQTEADAARCAGGHQMVLGYTSNLDVLLEWDGAAFARIADEYLKDAPAYAAGDRIDSMEDFARIVTHFLAAGRGAEVDIAAPVCEILESRFETAYALGGTCAQGAAALGALGFPATAYLTDRSRAVCDLMDRPGIALYADGRVAPIGACVSGEPPVRHVILQYPQGAEVKARGITYRAPASNRMILDDDQVHKTLPIEPGFLAWCEEHASDIRVLGISGFNAIVDLQVLTDRLDLLTAHYKAFRARNPRAAIYLEGAYYLNPDVKDLAFERLARSVDVLGMNEEELVEHAARLGRRTDTGNLPSILEALQRLLSRCPAKGIVLHTADYSMYFGRKLPGVDLPKGLALGNLMSGTRARTGRYGTKADCLETLETQPLSAAGVQMASALSGIRTGEHLVQLVPTLRMEQPRCTIGLGDTFTAGMLTAFIREAAE